METEVYSPDFDQWTMVAQLSMGQSEAGACLVNDRIFIVGGYCWSARRCIKVIQVSLFLCLKIPLSLSMILEPLKKVKKRGFRK